jgi:hypothetical protein
MEFRASTTDNTDNTDKIKANQKASNHPFECLYVLYPCYPCYPWLKLVLLDAVSNREVGMFWFVAPWLLLGLVALAIPPIIHLLNRRRFDVVDWGAMQFLQISEKTRRRLLLEELLLMLLRIGLLFLLVFGLANPFVEGMNIQLRLPGTRPNRDAVLIFDGSYSMGCTDGAHTAHDAAKVWALDYLAACGAGDKVAVLQAKQQVVPVVGALDDNLQRVRTKLDALPPPAGGCDWPQAIQAAEKIMGDSHAPQREIIVLSDGQKYGWADEPTVLRWGLLATQLGIRPDEDAAVKARRPRITVLNLDPERKADLPNWSLTNIRSNRVVAAVNRELIFRTDIVIQGTQDYTPPYRVRLEVDGQFVRNLEPPRSKPEKGKVPFSFTHRFGAPGSHLISIVLEPDPPPEKRAEGYKVKDYLPGDNRQDLAIEVVPGLPVLVVDGDPSALAERRGADFLRNALTPVKKGKDPTPLQNISPLQAEVVSIQQFDAAKLNGDPISRPRVLILCNVEKLTQEQQDAVSQYLGDGGGVLATLGDRVDPEFYNTRLFHNGEGWLPAKLDAPEGDDVKNNNVVRPAPASFTHPSLDLFRDMPGGGLADAQFPRWWKLAVPDRNAAGVEVASLRSATADYPFLVERSYRAGRVLLCSVPLDNSWGTNLTGLPAIVPLAHELVYYLAGARSSEFNLQPGQPLRHRVETDAPAEGFTLEPPFGEAKPLRPGDPSPDTYPAQLLRQTRGQSLVYQATRETGVYKLQTPENTTIYYVVQPDAHESNLTPTTEADRERVSKIIPLNYQASVPDAATTMETSLSAQRQEFWILLLVGVIMFLCAEVWMTRRLVKNR